MRFYYTQPGGLTLKGLAIPGVGNVAEQWKFSYTTGGSENWYKCFVKLLFHNCSPLGYELNSCILSKNVGSSIICDSYSRNNPDVDQLRKGHIHCGVGMPGPPLRNKNKGVLGWHS